MIDPLRGVMARNAQLIDMGRENIKYQRLFRQSITRYPQHFACRATPDEGFARAIYAGFDLLRFPSICVSGALGPLIGLRHGAIPIVRQTGGLAETIPDYTAEPHRCLGFTFVKKKPTARLAAMPQAWTVCRKEAKWQALNEQARKADYSWAKPANAYEMLHHNALS